MPPAQPVTRASARGPNKTVRLVAFVCTIVCAWLTAGLLLYAFPAADDTQHADVLFVLAPSADRINHAEALMDKGIAKTLVISAPQGEGARPTPALCDEKRRFRIICFQPDPVTTQGEARAFKRLADEHGWQSAALLTGQFHVTRARVILERCYSADLSVVAFWHDLPPASLAYHFVYETGAFAKVAFNHEC